MDMDINIKKPRMTKGLHKVSRLPRITEEVRLIYEFTSKNKVEGNLLNRIKILEEEPTFGVDSNSLLGRVMRLEHIIFTTEDFGPAFEELRNRVVKLETQNKQAKVNKFCWQDIIESPGCID
jgi:hypothetical protein